uniref:tRNA/rRNA methyltransferase SpoU type domain-containing protein n=1 Tax=Leptocylindrus danicus TaxID=163516 RepID=A0A7S2KE04_9STRA
MSKPKQKPKEEVMDTVDLPMRILRKAETAIQGRTSRFLIVVERCTDDHNYSAIIRTAEALGIQHLWLIDPQNATQAHQNQQQNQPQNQNELHPIASESDVTIEHTTRTRTRTRTTGNEEVIIRSTGNVNKKATAADVQNRSAHNMFARMATDWTSIREFRTTKECLDALREDGRTIWVTDLSQLAVRMTQEDLPAVSVHPNDDNAKNIAADDSSSSSYSGVHVVPERLAIVFGTESVGCTQEMLVAADLRVYLPLRGFADSLNLSVATALCLQQLFHLAPDAVGDMSEAERCALRRRWYPKLASQRILSRSEKKRRATLVSNIAAAKRIPKEHGHYDGTNEHELRRVEKLKNLPAWEKELAELDRTAWEKSVASVEKFVQDPPAPLTDMRRADEHRVMYVGKNTRKRNSENWQGMAATKNAASLESISAKQFKSWADEATSN